jgi:hypothetical protein
VALLICCGYALFTGFLLVLVQAGLGCFFNLGFEVFAG